MRIIAGQFRGAKLEAPAGRATRPLTDRVKETLFNVLGNQFDAPGRIGDVDVLDLFAGSGGLGLEALSRGAASCLFVERNRRSAGTLARNVQKLRVETRVKIAQENAWTMRIPAAPSGEYGLVFVDPPYKDVDDTLMVSGLLERIAPRLAPRGILMLRHALHTDFPADSPRGLHCVDNRAIGSMRVLLLGKPLE